MRTSAITGPRTNTIWFAVAKNAATLFSNKGLLMDDFIEAMQIFKKYMDKDSPDYDRPFYCEHDEMFFCGVGASKVSNEDRERLDELGFFVNSIKCFSSFKYGSC